MRSSGGLGPAPLAPIISTAPGWTARLTPASTRATRRGRQNAARALIARPASSRCMLALTHGTRHLAYFGALSVASIALSLWLYLETARCAPSSPAHRLPGPRRGPRRGRRASAERPATAAAHRRPIAPPAASPPPTLPETPTRPGWTGRGAAPRSSPRSFGRLDGETTTIQGADPAAAERRAWWSRGYAPRSSEGRAGKGARHPGAVGQARQRRSTRSTATSSTYQQAVSDGPAVPYERNVSGWLEFAGGLGGSQRRLRPDRQVLEPSQVRTMYTAGFEWGEYLGSRRRGNSWKPPPPPHASSRVSVTGTAAPAPDPGPSFSNAPSRAGRGRRGPGRRSSRCVAPPTCSPGPASMLRVDGGRFRAGHGLGRRSGEAAVTELLRAAAPHEDRASQCSSMRRRRAHSRVRRESRAGTRRPRPARRWRVREAGPGRAVLPCPDRRPGYLRGGGGAAFSCFPRRLEAEVLPQSKPASYIVRTATARGSCRSGRGS